MLGLARFSKVNSVQEACAKYFAVHILNFEILQIRPLLFNRLWILIFLFFCFFMWFARFQILISKPERIWRKLLVLS